jgi:hypothetical protein
MVLITFRHLHPFPLPCLVPPPHPLPLLAVSSQPQNSIPVSVSVSDVRVHVHVRVRVCTRLDPHLHPHLCWSMGDPGSLSHVCSHTHSSIFSLLHLKSPFQCLVHVYPYSTMYSFYF